MDPIIEVQYRRLVDEMAAQGIHVDAEFDEDGNPGCIFRDGVVVTRGDLDQVDRIAGHLGNHRVDLVPEAERGAADGIVELKISGLSVTEAVDRIAAREADRAAGDPPPAEVAPDHIIHICRICPAGEPLFTQRRTPFPPVQDSELGRDVVIAVCDTGLLPVDPATHPWLDGVTGEPGHLPPKRPDGVQPIGKYDGHGTFVAGVVRSMAPAATVTVGNHMQTAEAAVNSVFCNKLAQMIAAAPRTPDILVLSAGTLTKHNRPSVSWKHFHETVMAEHPNMVLIAAAGNNADDRSFWPAAFDWAYGVGALNGDRTMLADFSNFGVNADVFVQGEEMINAFPSGRYTYDEVDLAEATFTGMARWKGTSFATPLFAGMVAARMSLRGETAPVAADALLATAGSPANLLAGVGPALKGSWGPF